MIGPERAAVRTEVHGASFGRSTLSVEAWHAMAAGLPYADARCLVAYDELDHAVAGVTVWSAGAGRPRLLEPMGVHRDHRGHGRAITVAAAAALRELGSSSALVNTPSRNVAAVATYASAGFEAMAEIRDRRRDAWRRLSIAWPPRATDPRGSRRPAKKSRHARPAANISGIRPRSTRRRSPRRRRCW